MNSQYFNFSRLPQKAQRIMTKLQLKNIPFWLVGGIVRDWAAGFTDSRDIDMVARKNVWGLRRILGGEIIFCKFPHILLNDIEVLPVDDINNTLKRRDYTANAMAIDATGRLIDPYNGEDDVKNKIFRLLPFTSLENDPARALRGCRLCCRLDWQFDPVTCRTIQQFSEKYNWSRYLNKKGIKIAVEINKAFEDPHPSKFFYLLHNFQILKYIFPLLDKQFNDPDKLSRLFQQCDHLTPGDSSLKMFSILHSICGGKQKPADKLLHEIAGFLEKIYWDEVASNFGRYKNFLSSANMLSMLGLVNMDLNSQEARLQIITACNKGDFDLQKFLSVKKRVLGVVDSQENIIKITRQISRKKSRQKKKNINRK